MTATHQGPDDGKRPNPGSEEARQLGCSCAVIDNHYGRGFPYGGVQCFYVTQTCKVHGKRVEVHGTWKEGA